MQKSMWVKIKYANVCNLYSIDHIDLSSIYARLQLGTQEELRGCVDFALQHIFLPHFWNNRSVLQFHVMRERPHTNLLLCCWTFPGMGSLLNHLRKKHEADADTCQQEPRNTIAGFWHSQTPNLQRKAMLVHPTVLTTMLTKFPLHNGFAEVRWFPH